jgi:HlyD family secretion protein
MRKWIIAVIVLLVVGVGAYLMLGPGSGDDSEETATTPPDVIPPVSASDRVVAEAEVVPVRDVELQFELAGTVDQVLAQEGDLVQAGDTLAALDTRDLQISVEEAAATLAQRRADYELLLEGASDDEIAAARARVANAEASLRDAQAGVSRAEADVARASGDLQRTRGEVTQADINSARAALEEARETLADLEDGPDTVDVENARAALDEARANLENQRSSLSAAKTNAESEIELAANELRNAQANYSQVYWEIREIERELNTVDQQIWQDLKDREEQALRNVNNAEQRLAQARVSFEEAQNAERTGIQTAEARLRDAQATYDDVIAGAEPNELAAARAAVSRAEADLAKLLGEQRSGSVASAAAGVENAQAGVQSAQAGVEQAQAEVERNLADLEELASPPRKTEIDAAEAQVQNAEAGLQRAQRELDKASLLAPIDATVVEIDLEVGERIDTTQVAARLADFSEWEVVTTDLTELGIVRVQVGDPVVITFDALPDLELAGVVKTIQELGKNRQGDIVYEVAVTPTEWDERLKWGMTATVSIEADTAESDVPSDEAASDTETPADDAE